MGGGRRSAGGCPAVDVNLGEVAGGAFFEAQVGGVAPARVLVRPLVLVGVVRGLLSPAIARPRARGRSAPSDHSPAAVANNLAFIGGGERRTATNSLSDARELLTRPRHACAKASELASLASLGRVTGRAPI